MTREEYNSRTNENVSEDEFQFINRVYMAAGDSIDKDQFCRDIKKSGGMNATIAALTENVETAVALIKEQEKKMQRLAIFIAEQAEESSSAKLRKKAIALMGKREYITWKIENGKSLWQLDLDLIKELIKE